jgi:Tfp pilus assembly protein PilF
MHERLQRGAPGRDIEVITIALAAVTTHVLVDFVDEIIAVDPDAIVIYTGHNEYLGIGGVGSSYIGARSPGIAQATNKLRHLRSYRLLERALAPMAHKPRPDRSQHTLMARVAKEREIAFDSKLYRRGLEQFAANIARILDAFSRAGVPVLIGTLASNERDQAPFASALTPGADGAAWSAAVDAAAAALDAGNARAAERSARAALAIDEAGARAHYLLARALDSQGRYAAARAAYLAAKDRDVLRFRAPEALNDSIRRLAAAGGATLVDVESTLAAHARNGIVGNDLMLEHLHPNARGYFLIAAAFCEPLLSLSDAHPIADARAWNERPLTTLDELAGQYRIAILKSDWPFVPEPRRVELPQPQDDIERITQRWFAGELTWVAAMDEALVAYQREGNSTEAARVAVNLAEALVQFHEPQALAGRLLLRDGQAHRAGHYLARAIRIAPDEVDYALSLAEAQYKAGDPSASIATLEDLIRRAPGDPRARQWLEQVRGTGSADPGVERE